MKPGQTKAMPPGSNFRSRSGTDSPVDRGRRDLACGMVLGSAAPGKKDEKATVSELHARIAKQSEKSRNRT